MEFSKYAIAVQSSLQKIQRQEEKPQRTVKRALGTEWKVRSSTEPSGSFSYMYS